jgi:hypothetical protein
MSACSRSTAGCPASGAGAQAATGGTGAGGAPRTLTLTNVQMLPPIVIQTIFAFVKGLTAPMKSQVELITAQPSAAGTYARMLESAAAAASSQQQQQPGSSSSSLAAAAGWWRAVSPTPC